MSRELMVATGSYPAFHVGLVLTAFGFGFRHGVDWDHVAALTDITGSQIRPRRSMWFATLYALGHALVVFALGVAAIVLARRLPSGVDAVMERFVGATLVVLAGYVFWSLARNGRDFRMRSRWMLILSGMRHGLRWALRRARRVDVIEIEHEHAHSITEAHDSRHDDRHVRVAVMSGAATSATTGAHQHRHRHVITMPDDPLTTYVPWSAFGVGMIHGIGAETPTQVIIFVTAAGVGGKGTGLLLLACFVTGLLASNSLIAVAGTMGFLGATRNFGLYVAVSLTTAIFSFVVGSLFLFGNTAVLPAMLGG
jgi:high-affinity nickel-transport protein